MFSRIARNISLGIKSLALHKLRSLLTMLGVVFGVGSVIAMLAVGEGASQKALEQLRKLGSNNIIIESVKPKEDNAPSSSSTERRRMSIYGLLYDDQRRIAECFGDVSIHVPAKIARKEARLFDRTAQVRLVGTTPPWFDLIPREVIAGRVLLPDDVAQNAGVCVIAEGVAREMLVAGRSVVGQAIKIENKSFEIVGVIRADVSDVGGIETPDKANDVYIPISAYRERFGDRNVDRRTGSFSMEQVELHQLLVQVHSDDAVERTAHAIQFMLERFHKRVDYEVKVPLALLRQAEQTRRRWNIVLGSIAGISLLVGGIGIMNIMLATVTERTREIGIRRAIGAKRRQIIGQFLTETVVLSVVGGLLGVLLGVLLPLAVTYYYPEIPTLVTWWAVALSLTISAAVGIIFGSYPAYRAASVDPIIALRHE